MEKYFERLWDALDQFDQSARKLDLAILNMPIDVNDFIQTDYPFKI